MSGRPLERVFYFVEFAGDDGDEVGGAGQGLAPGPGLHGVGGIGDVDELAVGKGQPRGGHGEDRFGGEAIVGIVVGRKIVARVFGFSLGPDLFGAIRIILVREDEIEPFCRLAFVANLDVEFVAGLGCGGKRDDEFRGGGFELARDLFTVTL